MKSPKERAKELVAQMTLAEKCAQMKYDAPAIERLGVPAYNWWNEALHGVARSGAATVFPQAIGMAASYALETPSGASVVAMNILAFGLFALAGKLLRR